MTRIILFISLVACCFPAYASRPGLLTDDYGIVTDEDLRKNAEVAEPTDEKGNPFLIWQCFRLEKMKMHCEDMGYYPENGGRSAAPVLQIRENGKWIEFYFPHAWGADVCKDDIATWRRILRVGKVACFSGFYDRDTQAIGNLQKIKSKRGKWSYFLENGEPEARAATRP